MVAQIVRGPLLNPRPDGTVQYIADGLLAADASGRLTFVGVWSPEAVTAAGGLPVTAAKGVLLPPFLDAHIHISQHPIRGRFTEGIPAICPEGRLLAGLNRNVFPQEARAADPGYTAAVVEGFCEDTLAHGVVGGAAYMTVHPNAVEAALEALSPLWSVGLVLMNQNCPAYLRTDEEALSSDLARLTGRFGRRLIVTDRFAVAVDTPLRRRAAELAGLHGLRMQTHLNEQLSEKAFVEQALYPGYANYTDVYARDGLLDHEAIVAHCVHMSDYEYLALQASRAVIAHCPTSNTLLGSGIMPLDRIHAFGLQFALCTDVGASPTTSILAEMAQFLKVHRGRSAYASPQEALFRATLAPARILGVDAEIGSFEVGKPLSYIEIRANRIPSQGEEIDDVLSEVLFDRSVGRNTSPVSSEGMQDAFDRLELSGLEYGPTLAMLTADVEATALGLDTKVQSVTLYGKRVWQRELEARRVWAGEGSRN